MHSFEDFWAHSNWVELAVVAQDRAAKGEVVAQGPAANAKLKTGTFSGGSPAQLHALGHKLLALATEIQDGVRAKLGVALVPEPVIC